MCQNGKVSELGSVKIGKGYNSSLWIFKLEVEEKKSSSVWAWPSIASNWGSRKCQNQKVWESWGRFLEQAPRLDFARTQQCWDSDWDGPPIFRTAYSLNIAVSVTVLGMRSSYLGWRISCQGMIDGGVESVRTGKCQNWKVSESLFCPNWKVSELESVRISWNWEVPEFLKIGKCQNSGMAY